MEWLGEVEADGLALADGLCEADGLGVGLTLPDGDVEGLLLALDDGETDNDGDLLLGVPSSIKACPQLRESTNFLTSKFEPNLKDPAGPLSA